MTDAQRKRSERRLRILELNRERDLRTMTIGELADLLGVSTSTISKDLRELNVRVGRKGSGPAR